MRYRLAPLYCRPWTLNGISPRLIESHYENNYGGALNRLNAISEEIEQFDFGNTSDQSLARLKRDETAALNSTLLHELYFASLGGDGRVPANFGMIQCPRVVRRPVFINPGGNCSLRPAEACLAPSHPGSRVRRRVVNPGSPRTRRCCRSRYPSRYWSRAPG